MPVRPVSAVTGAGVQRSTVVPSPSSPYSFRPAEHAPPADTTIPWVCVAVNVPGGAAVTLAWTREAAPAPTPTPFAERTFRSAGLASLRPHWGDGRQGARSGTGPAGQRQPDIRPGGQD